MLKNRYIILVEDDEIMGASLLQRLELEGAQVLWLKQMFRALGAIRTPKQPIDAVICDIGLPDGSGEELFATLAQSKCRTRCKFLIPVLSSKPAGIGLSGSAIA